MSNSRLAAAGRQRRVGPPRPPAASHGSSRRGAVASGIIYQTLRAEIVSLARQPGTPISEKEIALAHGLSRTPVREAVLKLADEGLVEVFPQSGTFVARIPLSALPEAIVARKALEEMTTRLAAANATAEHLTALRAALALQRTMVEVGDREGFHEADEAFHAAIAAAAGYPGIWRIIQQLKVQVDRYRRLTLPVPGRMARAFAEHSAILAAIEARDPAGAAQALDAHLDGLQVSIASTRDLNPGYFAEVLEPRG